jgi:glycosyltransferase involved in cell wall biosynthesis
LCEEHVPLDGLIMALVTIGIPVYNEEKYLEQTIESAINQDFKDIDIVISDNGSTDRSAEIIKKYCSIDSRIKPIYKERNMGLSANYLSLLDNTRSKYFVMLGAHDLFLPNYIGEAVAFLESTPDYVMVYPQSKLVDGNDEVLGYTDSDIDTRGLNVQKRMKKIAANLSWCTCIHGVFRTDTLKELPIRQIRGADHLLLFAAAYHGHIHFMDMLGILRRESRQETPVMTEKRRIEAGNYYEPGSRFFNSWSVMAMEHVLFVMKKTSLPLIKKIALSFSVALIFKLRFNTSLTSIVFAYVHRK